jgi:anti-sigma factor RsiW
MTKKLNHNGALPSHLADEDIISYLDGEMSGVEQEQTGQHLESCWGCRSRLNAAQKSIENFMRLRHETLLPTELPPSGPALAQFRQRLRQHQAAPQQKAHAWLGLSRWREGASRFRAQVAHWFDSPLAVRGVVAALALAFVGALVLFYPTPATIVSASELLQRADARRFSQLISRPRRRRLPPMPVRGPPPSCRPPLRVRRRLKRRPTPLLPMLRARWRRRSWR